MIALNDGAWGGTSRSHPKASSMHLQFIIVGAVSQKIRMPWVRDQIDPAWDCILPSANHKVLVCIAALGHAFLLVEQDVLVSRIRASDQFPSNCRCEGRASGLGKFAL